MSDALPPELAVPVDDGAADHLAGMRLPALTLGSTAGPVDLEALAADLLVLYIYPRTGRPGQAIPPEWDAIPGARGCTVQSTGFRDHHEELTSLGARLAGLSSQVVEEQAEAADRLGLRFPLLSDTGFLLADALGLPTFDFEGRRYYRRITLVAEAGRVIHAFSPVFPPDLNAFEVVAWLRTRAAT